MRQRRGTSLAAELLRPCQSTRTAQTDTSGRLPCSPTLVAPIRARDTRSQTPPHKQVAKLVGESSLLEPSDARAAVAALHHIVERAARHDTAPDTLRRELLQLGMPKESAEAIVRPYAANLLAVREKAAQMGWLLPTLPDETDEAKGALAWRVEHRLACGGDLPAGGGVASDFTALLHLRAAEVGASSAGNDEKATGASGYTFEATRDDVILLLYELKQARAAAQHATQD